MPQVHINNYRDWQKFKHTHVDSGQLTEVFVEDRLMDGNKPDKVLPVTLQGCESNEKKAITFCKSKSKMYWNNDH